MRFWLLRRLLDIEILARKMYPHDLVLKRVLNYSLLILVLMFQ